MEEKSLRTFAQNLAGTVWRAIQKFLKAFGRLARNFFDITFLKYIIVGLSTTVLGTGIMYLFFNAFHLSYWFSSASNHIVASVITFFLNRSITFKVKNRSAKRVALYILNIAVCYFIGYGIARPISHLFFAGMTETGQDNLAMMVGLIIYKILSYFGQRFVVFREDR